MLTIKRKIDLDWLSISKGCTVQFVHLDNVGAAIEINTKEGEAFYIHYEPYEMFEEIKNLNQ
jgi:hypothetical protein